MASRNRSSVLENQRPIRARGPSGSGAGGKVLRLVLVTLVVLGLAAAGLAVYRSLPLVDPGPPPLPPSDEPLGPPPPPTLTLGLAYRGAGGEMIPFEPATAEGDRAVIPPTNGLEMRTNLGLRNYRIRLLDQVDKALISDDTPSRADGGLRYRIDLPRPLIDGHRYTVALDAEIGTELSDQHGRRQPERWFEIEVRESARRAETAEPEPDLEREDEGAVEQGDEESSGP